MPRIGLVIAVLASACRGDRSPILTTPTTLPSPADVASVAVSGTLTSPGFVTKFAALGRRHDNSTFDATSGAIWTTSNTAVASIVAAGAVKAEAAGEVDIVATYQNVRGVLHLAVPDVIRLEIDGMPANIGSSAQFRAVASLSNDQLQDVRSQAHWRSSNPSVAHSVGVGIVRSVAAGRPS